MLFPYTYVQHKMERMQTFINFIFYEVWCKAPIGLVFHPDLFEGEPDLMGVMTEFGFSAHAAERGKTMYNDVKTIYDLFAVLSPQEIAQFKQWYQSNNDLERMCANDPAAHLARYAEIVVLHEDLGRQLAVFFKDLYSPGLLKLAALRANIGDIEDHYATFVRTNKEAICPFCGIVETLSEGDEYREAYDHYLPKALYPFNSINFRNLAPACHLCNSTYKHSKDPAHNLSGRRKSFNPYAKKPYAIQIRVTLQEANIDKLEPADITMEFGPETLVEEIDTWNDLYNIKERYKVKLCRKNNGKYWLTQAREECRNYAKQPSDILKTQTQKTMVSPYAECNFLKTPFLEACQRIGLFEDSLSNVHPCS